MQPSKLLTMVFGLLLLLPITVDAMTVTESVVVIHGFDNATDKFNFSLERAPPDEEFMATIVALPEQERETLAITTTEKCDYILDVEELSDYIKSVFANCVKDKTTIELMNSINFKDYIGWALAIIFGVFAIWAYFKKKKSSTMPNMSNK